MKASATTWFASVPEKSCWRRSSKRTHRMLSAPPSSKKAASRPTSPRPKTSLLASKRTLAFRGAPRRCPSD